MPRSPHYRTYNSYSAMKRYPYDRLLARCVRAPNGCLEFQGHLHDGYAMIRRGSVDDGYVVWHRLVWEIEVRPIPLFLGTRADNNADKTRKGRQARGPEHGLRGERHPNAKLSARQVAKIRRLAASKDLRYADIAAKFAVSPTMIGRIVRGERWRVPSPQ